MVKSERTAYSVYKTNIIIYQGCTYTLPAGTYRAPSTNVLVERQGQELVVFDQDSREIARQPISPIKGVQVRNNSHKRDTSQSINDLVAHTSLKFGNPEQAIEFLEKVRKANHRYARDQIRLIARVCDRYSRQEIDAALEFCLSENILIGNDFEPVLMTLAGRQVSTPETAKPLSSNLTRQHRIIPQTSNINDYKQILE